ncbi:TPA: hypothetical protein ACH3X2_005650 [Trebouxia sp. C0005]|nr:MAG: hypothetical protein FRX49_08791 [Trebouxia sp. A1-2]
MVRLKDSLEAGLQYGRKAKAHRLPARTQLSLRQLFSSSLAQLQKLAERDQDKENLPMAGNRQAAEPAEADK